MFYLPAKRPKTNWPERLKAFKKIIKDHPYTATHYVSQHYPDSLLKEEEFRLFQKKHDNE